LIHSQRSPGAAASQLIEDVESMDGYFARFWPQQLLALLTPLLILIVVFYYNWLAALFLLVAAPLIPLFMMLIGWGAEAVNQRFFYQRQRLAGHFLDRVKHLT
ncbi:ABC transporter transmembrane domain-containing protein, partial [Methylophaga sp. UBA3595]